MAYEEILTTSGGTITGKIRLQKGQDVANLGTNGTAGYVKICTLKITTAYQNAPIEIAFARRNDSCITRIAISFTADSSTDPTLKFFKTFGSTTECWLYKSATSTWDLYTHKTEGWDVIDILSFYQGGFLAGITVTWDGTLVTTIPSGAIQASLGYQVGYALSSETATKLGASTIGSPTQPFYLNAGAPTACTYTLGASVPSGAKFTDTVTTVTTSGSGNAITAITASNGALTVTKGSTFLTTVTKASITDALGYTPCRAWTVTVPSGSSGSKAITVSGATFGKAPLIAKSSGSDDDYNKITAVSATTNTLTFTLSAATSAALTLMVIETF